MRASSSYFFEPSGPVPEMPILRELLVGGDGDSLSVFPSERDLDNSPRLIVPVPKRHAVDNESPRQVHAGDARINHILDRLTHVEEEFLRVAGALRDLETRVETGSDAGPPAHTCRDFVWPLTQWTTVRSKVRAAAEGVRDGFVQGAGIIAGYTRAPVLYAVLPAAIIAGAALVRPAANIEVPSPVAQDRRPSPDNARLVEIALPAVAPPPAVNPPGIPEAPPPVVKSRRVNIVSSATAGRRETPRVQNPASESPHKRVGGGLAFVGTLVIDSVPRGAVVMVDYREVGVTPMRISNLNAGRYAVWLVRDGYSRWTDAVVVPASKVTHVSARLERSSESSTP